MKNLVFVLISALSVALTSCSLFDSDSIEPEIIGVGNLQYNAKNGTWFVSIDSTQYTIASVFVRDDNPCPLTKIRKIEPIAEMFVTVFTTHKMSGIQAIEGEKSAAEIKEFCETGSFIGFVFFGLLLVCVFGVITHKNEEAPVVNTDV